MMELVFCKNIFININKIYKIVYNKIVCRHIAWSSEYLVLAVLKVNLLLISVEYRLEIQFCHYLLKKIIQ